MVKTAHLSGLYGEMEFPNPFLSTYSETLCASNVDAIEEY